MATCATRHHMVNDDLRHQPAAGALQSDLHTSSLPTSTVQLIWSTSANGGAVQGRAVPLRTRCAFASSSSTVILPSAGCGAGATPQPAHV